MAGTAGDSAILDYYGDAGAVWSGYLEAAVVATLGTLASNSNSRKVSVIVGLGKTGLSCARYLAAKGEDFMVVDSRLDPPGLDQMQNQFPHVKVELGDFQVATFVNARLLIVSPGVSLDEEAIRSAIDADVPITGDIDIFSRVVNAPLVAVTGSNGKSTVVSLVAEICQQAGISFGLGGNLEAEHAFPALDLLQEPDREIYILELSSFQLETTSELGAEVAVILNLSEDHMDRYSDLDAYLRAKQRIFNGAHKIVVNRDSDFSRPPSPVDEGMIEFGLQEPEPGVFGIRQVAGEEWLAYGDSNLVRTSSLKIFGKHNFSNVLAAMAISEALGVNLELAASAAERFAGLPHRCQWVAQVDGVDFYNDSKGTNVGATVAAVEGLGQKLSGKVVLIAGGVGKGADFSPLHPVVKRYASSVVLLGSAATELAGLFKGLVPVFCAGDMCEAVAAARTEAEAGDAVLLSPACASFDMFDNFVHRGQQFIDEVGRLQ
ncbi:MAG: UDP-N-acetylmuramoyl-L-alanine--D-glutamate ligase [Gammaproteobacteria bacterium]|nr:UDP-N-acetylmuramoyl-L-alanine--D-glutamate ligase [Gammaproteobacteria bacterium]